MMHAATNENKGSNHFEVVFEYATVGILVTDSSREIKAINSFALNKFGYTEIELIGKTVFSSSFQKISKLSYGNLL